MLLEGFFDYLKGLSTLTSFSIASDVFPKYFCHVQNTLEQKNVFLRHITIFHALLKSEMRESMCLMDEK